MRYAYVHKNLRQLSFEKKVILGGHLITMFACFLPWFEANPTYEKDFLNNAFEGPGFLLGIMIFTISFVVALYFADKLLEKKLVKLPISDNQLFFGTGAQQLLLIVLLWSVLLATGRNYGDHAIRFGAFVAFIAQVAVLVAAFLNYQLEKQQQAKSFFQHPNQAPEKVTDTHE